MSLLTPSQARTPIGSIVINGQSFDVVLNQEWARYFFSLNSQVVASANTAAEGAQHAPLMMGGDGDGDVLPGPPGLQGFPGAPGPAMFMLAETPDEPPLMLPPAIDNVYVPLASKDASNGVSGLTLFKLNLKNAAGTVINFLTNATTAARTWTMPDKDGTVAMLSDFAAPPAIGNTTAASGKFTTFGCNGAAPQTSYPSGGAVATTGATNAAPYGFTTAAQANDIVSKINTLVAAGQANGTLS